MYFNFCTSPGIFCSPCVHKTARLNTTIQKAHDAGRMDNTGRASVEEEGKFNSYTNKQCLHDRKPFPVEKKKKSTQSDTVTSGIIHTSGCDYHCGRSERTPEGMRGCHITDILIVVLI